MRIISLILFGLVVTTARADAWNGQPGVLHIHPAPRGHMVYLGKTSIILFDGRRARISTDSGRTWGDPFTITGPAGKSVSVLKVVRVGPGRLAALGSLRGQEYGGVEGGSQLKYELRVSEDDGLTWSSPRPTRLPEERFYIKFNRDSMIRLRTGRILVPLTNYFGKTPEYDFTARPFLTQGLWGSYAFYTDDEGLTWDRSHDDVIVHMAIIRAGEGQRIPRGQPMVWQCPADN